MKMKTSAIHGHHWWAVVVGILLYPPGSSAGSSPEEKLADANTGFAFKLLKEIAKEQPGKNVFISPHSVSSVLQMLLNGAGGKTKEELQQVLGTTEITLSALNQANANLSRAINGTSSNVVLNSANAIWYRKGILVKPEFLDCNRQFYRASVDALNFSDHTAVRIMNGWVNQITHGRIPSIVADQLDPEVQLFLANAVYFKGGWMVPFKAKDTKEHPFHLRGGHRKDLRMMRQAGEFSYRRGTGSEV
jgi:serpin B